MDLSVASISTGEDVRPYKIHVSSKYLDLTKKKLELTRLPHELLLPRTQEWSQGTPKSQVEPLIDFWLENYNWRSQENYFNSSYPQYRAAIRIASSPIPIRLHFIHIKSPHPHAVPLLLLPSFPLTNISLSPLFNLLTDPANPRKEQPFHLIIPSLPGLGFSDAITSPPSSPGPKSSFAPTSPSLLESTAGLLNTLMLMLEFPYYLVSGTGSGIVSPAHIDYHLPRLLARNHGTNCLGIHVIDPPISEPTLVEAPWSWFKFMTARFFHANIWGYTKDDWDAAVEAKHGRHRWSLFSSSSSPSSTAREPDLEAGTSATSTTPLLSHHGTRTPFPSTASHIGLSPLSLRAPNTLAYALCDSPVGLLSLVLHTLRRVSPNHSFTKSEIIDLTQLAWLPGPEGAMRFWSAAATDFEESRRKTWRGWSDTCTSVTVFTQSAEIAASAAASDGIGASGGSRVKGLGYMCPVWASLWHRVVHTARYAGSGGLVAWERPDAVAEGCRGLAEEALKRFPELLLGGALEDVIENAIAEEEVEVGVIDVDVNVDVEVETEADSPDTIVLSPGADKIR